MLQKRIKINMKAVSNPESHNLEHLIFTLHSSALRQQVKYDNSIAKEKNSHVKVMNIKNNNYVRRGI